METIIFMDMGFQSLSSTLSNLHGLSLLNICFLSDSTLFYPVRFSTIPADSLPTHETKAVLVLSNQLTKQKCFSRHMLQTRTFYICT